MNTSLILILIIISVSIFAQTNPVEVKVSDKLLINNEGDTSQLVIKSATQSSVIDLQGANISTIRFLQDNVSKGEVRLSGNNFDLYSMPPVTFPQLRTPTIRMTSDRQVGINKGLLSPSEALDVNGRLKIGYTEGGASPGVLRYNPDEKKFESYNGANWKSFGSLSLDNDGDSGIRIVESGVDSIVFKVNGNEDMRFCGHALEFGKDGNTYIGKGVTPSDVPQNIANTVTGWLSASSMSSGVSNTIYGFRSSEELSTGDFNTIVGSETANKLSFGSRNTYLGYRSGWNAGPGNSGNVFIGYKAGQDYIGSDRLVIANSETSTPLIDGNFASKQLGINGNLDIDGNTVLDGQVQINGVTTIDDQLTSQDIKIDDNDPFLEFKQLGNSQFYFQYQSSNDQLVLVESGVGQVAKFNNGNVFFPTLGNEAGKEMTVDNEGKVVFVEPMSNPTLTYYGTEFSLAYGDALKIIDLTKDFQEYNKFFISELRARFDWDSDSDTPAVILRRMHRATGNFQVLKLLEGSFGSYNQYFSSSMNHIVNTDDYSYYLLTDNSYRTVMEVQIE
ncbi:hypothetical protein [Portibacter marinus]|uniref:hypothetical protein n=1 Tax=Portibacter marinus TaxID=2898660 RepID=UPI001F2F67D0|nr:hypothetical protein [Portibacter marinus]